MCNWIKNKSEFWSPVLIAIGITFLTSGITNAIRYGSPPYNEWGHITIIVVSFIMAIILVILGFNLTKISKDMMKRTLFISGFSLLLTGMNNYYLSQITGQIVIGISLFLLIFGIVVFAFRKI